MQIYTSAYYLPKVDPVFYRMFDVSPFTAADCYIYQITATCSSLRAGAVSPTTHAAAVQHWLRECYIKQGHCVHQ